MCKGSLIWIKCRLMEAADFIAKWRPSELKERSAAQEHFLDLCRLLGEPTPAEVDPKGEFYCFERGAAKGAVRQIWTSLRNQDGRRHAAGS
jgi:hypothetical protein|tara:strand:- start:985 stop:1257 length:273 start_codon:yes stop_codon:yes gene_type:complete